MTTTWTGDLVAGDASRGRIRAVSLADDDEGDQRAVLLRLRSRTNMHDSGARRERERERRIRKQQRGTRSSAVTREACLGGHLTSVVKPDRTFTCR